MRMRGAWVGEFTEAFREKVCTFESCEVITENEIFYLLVDTKSESN